MKHGWLAVHAIFIAIGHVPHSDLFAAQLELDHDGYLVAGAPTTRTKIKDVFACGDVVDRSCRRAVTAACMWSRVALDVEGYLASRAMLSPDKLIQHLRLRPPA